MKNKGGRTRNDGLVPGSPEAQKADEAKKMLTKLRRSGHGRPRRDGLSAGSPEALKVDMLRKKGKLEEAKKIIEASPKRTAPIAETPGPRVLPPPLSSELTIARKPSSEDLYSLAVELQKIVEELKAQGISIEIKISADKAS